MNPAAHQRREPPATITDHWRLTQLETQRQRYKDNPLIQEEIERELHDLLEVLRERGGLL